MKKIQLIFIMLALYQFHLIAQETFPVTGIRDERATVYAFKNATIVIDYRTTIQNADLIIRKDKILQVGKNLKIPDHAIEFDLTGKFIYPSLVEIYSTYGIPSEGETRGSPQSFRISLPFL